MFNLDVIKWNYKRNKLEGNALLEHSMFDEEVLEWDTALKDYLEGSLFIEDVVVDLVDALCDAIFVDSGSKAKGFFMNNTDRLSYMMSVTTEILIENNINPSIIEKCLMLVVEANNLKPLTKTSGKVTKGTKWIDPKILIKSELFPISEVEDEQVSSEL